MLDSGVAQGVVDRDDLADVLADAGVDVVVQGGAVIGSDGPGPLDQIDIQALGQQVLDEGVARNQVQDEGLVDDGVDQKHRGP